MLNAIALKDSAFSTVRVETTYIRSHPRYGKVIKKSKVYLAHDPKNQVCKGQVIKIKPCVKVSKKKSWAVVYD